MHCNKCGTELPDDARFCTSCGEPFEQVEADSLVNYEPKTVYDLYNASERGDVEEVKAILEHQPEMINEPIEEPADGGGKCIYNAIFSSLLDMKSSGINYDILEAFTKAGQDYNHCVRIKYDYGGVLVRPIIFYVITWNNLEIARYLLEHGADPNAVEVDSRIKKMLLQHIPLCWNMLSRNARIPV